MKNLSGAARPLYIVFCIGTLVFLSGMFFFKDSRVDFRVLLAANFLFFGVSLLAFRMQVNAMHNSNPNVFIRSVMSGMILKMFVCIAAVVGYVLLSGKYFNKPSVYLSMAVYLVYLVTEVGLVMKLNKRKNA